MESGNILIVTYGGGHVRTLLPIIQKLKNYNFRLITIGLTTAKSFLIKNGIDDCLSSNDLLEEEDKKYIKFAEKLLEDNQHPDIDISDAIAYHTIGIRELVENFGLQKANEMAKKNGRLIYEPFGFAKRFLKKTKPNLLITSICPRTELAFQKAAYSLKIKSLAVCDTFLNCLNNYVFSKNYSQNITVLCEKEKVKLQNLGFKGGIIVGGNPALDSLFDKSLKAKSELFKRSLNIDNKKIISWCTHPKNIESLKYRHQYVNPEEMIEELEKICSDSKDKFFLVRQHPNSKLFKFDRKFKRGLLCPENVSPETFLYSSDQVIVERSTMGLQAALIKKPVYTLWHKGDPPLAEYKLAKEIDSLKDLRESIKKNYVPDLNFFGYPMNILSTNIMVENILKILEES